MPPTGGQGQNNGARPQYRNMYFTTFATYFQRLILKKNILTSLEGDWWLRTAPHTHSGACYYWISSRRPNRYLVVRRAQRRCGVQLNCSRHAERRCGCSVQSVTMAPPSVCRRYCPQPTQRGWDSGEPDRCGTEGLHRRPCSVSRHRTAWWVVCWSGRESDSLCRGWQTACQATARTVVRQNNHNDRVQVTAG